MECVQRQLLEIESLSAIYFEDDHLRVDQEALKVLQAATGDEELPALSLSVRVGKALRLAAVLPPGYPETAPLVWLEPEDEASPRQRQLAEDDALCLQLQDSANELGEECLLPLIQLAEELLQAAVEETPANWAEECEDGDDLVSLPLEQLAVGPSVLGRRAMFSHHIIAPSKRQAIKEWAHQLDLGGMVKIGWPGVIIVEGEERKIAAYVDALSRLRWKHFVVRAEQTIDVASDLAMEGLRLLPVPLEEYPPDGMSDFCARCRDLGAEELLLAALKIAKKGKQ